MKCIVPRFNENNKNLNNNYNKQLRLIKTIIINTTLKMYTTGGFHTQKWSYCIFNVVRSERFFLFVLHNYQKFNIKNLDNHLQRSAV
jgi:hypothetical protein